MTALTQPPGRLLSVPDYAALSEDDRNRWELREGNLVASPSPTPRHMVIAAPFRCASIWSHCLESASDFKIPAGFLPLG